MTATATRLRALSRAGRSSAHVSADDHTLMRFVGAAQLAAGGVLLLIVLAVPDPDVSDHIAYTLLAGIGLVGSVARWSARAASTPVARAWNAGTILYVGGIVAVSRPVGPAAFLMLWPVLSTAYFLGRRDLAGAMALMSLTLLAALRANPAADQSLMLELVPAVAVVGLASLMMLLLRERLDRLISDLERTASTDGLTGLPNRRSWNASFVTEVERARRSGQPLSIAIFDLDRFKAINDCLGHAEGDRALIRFSSLLATECRSFDVPGRLGGEEFGLLLAGASAEGAMAFAERLRSRLELVTRHDETPFTVSAGIAQLDVHAEDIEAMMLAA
ncbi:MAG: GGDEF domain-containing protein, partial [Solirubrobacteraceae bacterium]|nr:GGDEF domain-containing protein [Solirubrobacteraceae bacterium]